MNVSMQKTFHNCHLRQPVIHSGCLSAAECCGTGVSTPALYSGGPVSKSWPGDLLS
jgi:hypothetical protein